MSICPPDAVLAGETKGIWALEEFSELYAHMHIVAASELSFWYRKTSLKDAALNSSNHTYRTKFKRQGILIPMCLPLYNSSKYIPNQNTGGRIMKKLLSTIAFIYLLIFSFSGCANNSPKDET